MGFKSLRKALEKVGKPESEGDYLERARKRKRKAQQLMKQKKGK